MPISAPIRRRDKLDKHLRRYHRRLKDYHGNGRATAVTDDVPSYVIAAPATMQ